MGDDPAYTAEQLGHTDARFTLHLYTSAVKRRERLSGAELKAFDAAIEWLNGHQWALTAPTPQCRLLIREPESRPSLDFRRWAVLGSNQ